MQRVQICAAVIHQNDDMKTNYDPTLDVMFATVHRFIKYLNLNAVNL